MNFPEPRRIRPGRTSRSTPETALLRADRSGMKDDGERKTHPMNNLLNIIIVLLIVGWLVGYISFGAAVGNLIHILLVLAVIAIVYRLVTGRKAL